MKHFIALTILTAFFTIISNAQNENLDLLINQFCKDLNPDKMRKMSPEKMQLEFLQIGDEIRSDYNEEVNEIFKELKKENPNLSDNDVKRIYFQRLLYRGLEICPEYKEIALISLGNCPEENKTLKKLLREVEKVISRNKKTDYSELNELIVNSISTTLFANRDQVEKDYKNGLADSQLMADMNNYLFHNSTEYLKIILSTQIDKVFDEM